MLECWNIGNMVFDLQPFEPMAQKGYWAVGLMEIIGRKIELKMDKIFLKPLFHHSTIPLFQ
jgi:hypothetical protein